MNQKQYDLIIIGGGPAGMAAGIYGARENLDILLITKDFGGQIKRKSIEIENYPGFKKISGQKLIQRFESHLKKFKIPTIINKVVKIKKQGKIFSVLTENKQQFKSYSIIIASGADPRPLEVKGEKELIGRGVSYCVTCDGPLYKNKTVAVIGGGNAGFEAAIFLSRIAEKIYILEYGSEVKTDEINQKRAKRAKNIEVITNAGLKEIKGKNFVESITYEDNKTKDLETLKVNGVFIEIGTIPATGFVKGLVEFNKIDEIIIDAKTGETKIPGLFAAGDITDENYKQIVIAAGQGAKAVLSASRYLQKLKDN
ncbi:FAD-dependent oxidoreductase [Candidatus Parcubacteria bacterium]|nr:FAD-dependent oxidoreductase [Candidatus Parcubacteria bacterium]